MTRNKKITFSILFAVALWAAVLPVSAQDSTQPVINIKPIPPPKIIHGRFEVLHMMQTAIQVRSVVDQRQIHTFAYSDQIRGRMQEMFDEGRGYQYGDKIDIKYKSGTEVALNIRGKPSKPS